MKVESNFNKTEAWTFQRSSSPVRHQGDNVTTRTDKFYTNFVNNLHKPRIGRVRGIPQAPPGIFSGFLMTNNGNKRTTTSKVDTTCTRHERVQAREDVHVMMRALRL